MKSEYIVLAGRIKRALLDLEGVVKRAEWLQSKAQTSGDDGFFDGVALNLHGFYSGGLSGYLRTLPAPWKEAYRRA